MGCIAEKTGKPFSNMKTLFDCTSVAAAIVLSFQFLGGLDGIREGTVLTALLVGRTTGYLRRFLSPLIRKVCFPE